MDTRQQVLLIVAVLLVTLVTSFGFQYLTGNPLRPDVTLNASDVPEENVTSRSGTIEWFTIQHLGGEPIDLSETEIVIGSGDSAIRLSEANNWTVRRDFVYRVHGETKTIHRNHTFVSGDRLLVTMTVNSGTTSSVDWYRLRVRVRHVPSQSAVYDELVRIR